MKPFLTINAYVAFSCANAFAKEFVCSLFNLLYFLWCRCYNCCKIVCVYLWAIGYYCFYATDFNVTSSLILCRTLCWHCIIWARCSLSICRCCHCRRRPRCWCLFYFLLLSSFIFTISLYNLTFFVMMTAHNIHILKARALT